MSDTDTIEIDVPEIPESLEQPQTGSFSKELYKKWFKAGSNAGFLSITPWLAAGKFTIDVGKVDPNGSAVLSNTKCYIDAVRLGTYLRAVVSGTGANLFPKRQDCPSPESFVVYGGTAGADPKARVFKIHWWGAKADSPGDEGGFAWKCGEFGGKVTDTGAITPLYDKPVSTDMIKVTRQEMAEIAYRIDLCLIGHAAKFSNWYDV
jgi:hypothetical protein